jgi:SpoVK/Ycf46/Vps4 family AAA+-type ATPase
MTAVDSQLSAAARRAMMDDIVVGNPRMKAAHDTFDYLIEHAELQPGRDKRCVALIAPSQSGKTTIIDSYIKQMNTPEAMANGDIPALKVTLQANISRRQFAQDILESFERFGCDALVETGTEAQLLRRAAKYLLLRRVRILFLDEFHHVVHSDNRKVVMSVSETVKRLLITGNCPIVVAGLRDARRPFDANAQLAHRAEPHLDLSPLDPARKDHTDLFKAFLLDYLGKADQLGVADNLLDLMNGDTPACIWEVSRGVLGAACNLIKEAVHLAAIDSSRSVVRADLARATENAIRNRLYDRNPFTEGLDQIRPMEEG